MDSRPHKLAPILALGLLLITSLPGRAAALTLTQNRQLWDQGPDILALQQFLNTHGFTVATTGPGSLGHETDYFGSRTYRTLLRFQASHGIPATGFLGPLTRAAIAAMAISTPSSIASSSPAVGATLPSASSSILYVPSVTLLPGYAPGQIIFGGGGGGGNTPDTTLPSVSLTAPASGATVSGSSVTLTATASDDVAVASVQFKVDGADIGSAITSSPYTTSWNSTGVSDGAHTLYAVAEDTSGNYATSSISISVRNNPPEIFAITVTPTSSSATVAWTTDEAATSQVIYGTGTSYDATTTLDASLVTSHSVALSGLTPDTAYHFEVISTDAANNTQTTADQIFYTPSSLWVLQGASVDMDFAAQQYYGGSTSTLLTVSRASSETCTWADGHLSYAGNNTPCITDLGMAVWESRTNVVLWDRDLTNAAWTATNATVAEDQTGADNAASSASSILATAANATVLQSITLASSARFETAYVKRITGSGEIDMTMDDGTTWTPITSSINSSTYTRVSIPTQTLANPDVGFRIVTNGDKVAVDFVQNENGVFATAPILATSTSSTRPSDYITPTGTLSSLLASNTFTAYATLPSTAAIPQNDSNGGGGFAAILAANCGAFDLENNDYGFTGGISSDCSTNLDAGSAGYGTDATVAASFSPSGRSMVWDNGAVATDTVNIGGGLNQIGGADGANGYGFLDTYLTRLAFWDTRLADSKLQQLGEVLIANPNTNVGYNRLAFYDDFNSTSTIDMNATGASGFNWYPQGWFGANTTPSSNVSISNGILTLSGPTGGGGLHSAIAVSGAPYYTGTAFGGGAYFEARIAFDPALGANASADWPAFWSEAIEHVIDQEDGGAAEHWSGQAAGYAHFDEYDFMEAIHTANQSYVGKTNYYTTEHDWSGEYIGGSGWQYNIANNDSHDFTPWFNVNSIDWNQFHTYGALWVPQNGSTPGYVQWFFDGIPGPKVYYKGPFGSPPLPGQSGSTYEAGNSSLATTTYSILDSDHMALTLETDP